MSAKLIPVAATCIKIGYDTEREAWDAARLLRDAKVKAYKCVACGEWHIGHGELGRRSSYKFSHNRTYISRAYQDRLNNIFAALGL